MRLIFVKNFLVALSLIVWLFNYAVKNFLIEEISYVNDFMNLAIIAYLVLKSRHFRFFFLKYSIYLLLFVLMELVFMLNDKFSDWIVSVHLSNIYFTFIAFVLGKNFSYFFLSKYFNRSYFFFACAFLASSFLIYYFYIMISSNWNFYTSLPYTDLAEYYQGVGRIMTLITIFLLHNIPKNPIRWLLASFAIYIILDYRSIGAGFGVAILFLYMISKTLLSKKPQNIIILILSSLIVYLLLSYFGIIDYFVNSYELFNTRLEGKIEYESRQYYLEVAQKLIFESPYNFIFGVGPLNFNDYLGQISGDRYLYVHNVFLELLIYFGIFGVIFFVVIIRALYINFRYFFNSRDPLLNLLSVLFTFYFLLANIGSDFSGNRFFINVMVMIYSLYPYAVHHGSRLSSVSLNTGNYNINYSEGQMIPNYS